ncbi:cytochrome b/b6 domain-containing protein [Novosphingobium sp.]|uniref:cytochrome b/b6 domain-containing protein n=1 Tax=Novosphingobium sp. TaxID=1874826 RepID=UPI0025F167AE|nr:cytochrome b/b6 domain-containing protein [Novosphingobium sp.]MCC6925130.1 cytochrome b/b6 domain-containing protein [Novosphingobium sp.]
MEAKNWDPIVKLTHWGIVTAVIGNALVTEEGSGWHIWVGYGLAALLALRLLWGLVGPREARFGSFPPSLARATHHLGEIRRGEVTRHASHNPLGALMAYAIWAVLLVVAGTGIAMSGPPPSNPSAVSGEHDEHGAKAGGAEHEERAEAAEGGEEGEEEEGPLLELHELSVNLLYVLIALHLMGVVFESRRSGPGIVRSMLPGGTRR